METKAPLDPNALLTRDAVTAALNAAGYPVSSRSLATWASRPGKAHGPPYSHFGKRVLYRWSDAIAWAEAKMSPTGPASAKGARTVQEEAP